MTGTDVVEAAGSQLEQIARGTDLDRIARLGLWLAAAESGSKDPNALGAAAALRIAYAESLGFRPSLGIANCGPQRCPPAGV